MHIIICFPYFRRTSTINSHVLVFLILGNHSCKPNAEVAFLNNNFVLSVKALVDIKQGDVSYSVIEL